MIFFDLGPLLYSIAESHKAREKAHADAEKRRKERDEAKRNYMRTTSIEGECRRVDDEPPLIEQKAL